MSNTAPSVTLMSCSSLCHSSCCSCFDDNIILFLSPSEDFQYWKICISSLWLLTCPLNTSFDASSAASSNTKCETSTNASSEATFDTSSEASLEISSEVSSYASFDASSDASSEASFKASSDTSSDVSSDASSEASSAHCLRKIY